MSKSFIRILCEEGETKVITYEQVFFRPAQLEHLADDERRTEKGHLISQLASSYTSPLFRSCIGLGTYLVDEEEITEIVDVSVRAVGQAKNGPMCEPYEEFIRNLWRTTPRGPDAVIVSRLQAWVAHYRERGKEDNAKRIEALIPEDDIPF